MLLQANISRLLATSVAVILAGWVGKIIFRGISIRLRFRRMRAQGIPIMEPYSMLLGHLPLMKSLSDGLPGDAHPTYANTRILHDWKKYFPTASACPELIYLDVWPFMPQPILMVGSPEFAAQMTQETPQPRHPMFGWAVYPVTGGLDILSVGMAEHRVWRSRLNPGFSSRNLFANFPPVLEEADVFAQQLKGLAGGSGDWGDMFPLYDKAVALTFDVIINFALGLRIHEQTQGPGPLLKALRTLITFAKFDNIKNRLERWTPAYNRVVSQNADVMRSILMPHIQARISDSDSTMASHKTVVDLALKELKDTNQQPTPEFVEAILSNLKIFLFAGHDTTAQIMCWVFWRLSKHPEALAALRAEHDEVLGPDPKMARTLLEQNPHKVNELRYTTAVIRETLRVHPIASTFRQANRDFEFVSGNVRYPTHDCMMQTTLDLMHRNPDTWPRATEFLPERYMVSEDHPLYPVKNAWRPFELGNTRCIGEGLAMMEMTLALVFTIRELDFEYNYTLWNQTQGREKTVPTTVNGEQAYRCGWGPGYIKDNLPTRVRTRA